jgi:DNA polymerase I-like protein with 3'-5' exonuclease and polymerase domains
LSVSNRIVWQPIRTSGPKVAAYATGGLHITVTPDYARGCIVTKDNVHEVFDILASSTYLSLDTETTGLYPYKGDKMFALVIGCLHQGDIVAFYFTEELTHAYALDLSVLFVNPIKRWVLFNAKFDMHFLYQASFPDIAGKIYDGKSGARIEFNDHMQYSLSACAERIGLSKSNEVDRFIVEKNLFRRVEVPGKDTIQRIPMYDKVPLDIISRYALQDAIVTYQLVDKQIKKLQDQDAKRPSSVPTILDVLSNESQLIKTVFNMERTGLRIDEAYVLKAIDYELDREKSHRKSFEAQTGKQYMASPKLFATIFAGHKHLWKYTEKGNPSFTSDVLTDIKNKGGPDIDTIAAHVLCIRDAKSRLDFYNGFLYYMDASGIVHPNLDPAGTATGRFSSSAPNFQNLTSEEEDAEYLIRRSIIPHSPGDYLVAIDYNQQEYRMMLDYAGQMDLIAAINDGLDVHEATAQLMGVTRKEAKTLNFMLLYGGGAQKLADELGISLDKAKELKRLYFSKLPKVRAFIEAVTNTAKTRGHVFNWFGRRLHFPNPEHAYRAPNAVIQGGCADVTKIALNRIDDKIKELKLKTRLILTVHDEIILNVPPNELHFIPMVKEMMENTYPYRNIQLTCSVFYSQKSLADPDMTEGLPA